MDEYSVYVMITRALNDRNKCTTADLAEAEGGNPAAAMEVSLMRLNEVLEDDDFSEEDMRAVLLFLRERSNVGAKPNVKDAAAILQDVYLKHLVVLGFPVRVSRRAAEGQTTGAPAKAVLKEYRAIIKDVKEDTSLIHGDAVSERLARLIYRLHSAIDRHPSNQALRDAAAHLDEFAQMLLKPSDPYGSLSEGY